MAETCFGAKREKMSNSRRKELAGTGRGSVEELAVEGAKDRATSQFRANVVTPTEKETLQGSVKDQTTNDAPVCVDDAKAYATLPFAHEAVKRPLSEYVKGKTPTNGVEPFGQRSSALTGGRPQRLRPKHLNRYATVLTGNRPPPRFADAGSADCAGCQTGWGSG